MMIVSIKQLQVAFKNVVPHMVRAQAYAVKQFAEKRIPQHFTFAGQKDAGYKPLTPKYAIAKARKYGIKPILVASGKLKNTVKRGWRVIRRGNTILLNVKYPRYGSYQRRDGRDFLKITRRDSRYIIHMLRRRYITIRKKPFIIR